MKGSLIKGLILSIAMLALTATPSFGDLSVDEIVDKANKTAYYAGNDGKADVTMTITDSQGRTRIRGFTILRMDIEDGGEQKFYVYFKKPEDVREMVYMVWKHINADDDRWLYLPALDLVRRISATDKRSSFVGSNFLYEDVSGRNITDDAHELVETTGEHYKLKNVPKNEKSVEFSYYYLWISKDSFLPFKAEYYNKQGKLQRIVESLEVKTIQGHPTVTRSQVTDLESGGNTVSEFSNISYDLGITEDI
ncbi:MAG: outer membrane lipoprotein-sorting protein, partial [Candidatus Omnitrophota bacterium]